MKNLSALVIIATICVIAGLGILGFCRTLYSTIPIAIAASDVRAVDELIGEKVLIKFITGAGFGESHEKIEGLILKRRGEFLVIQAEIIRGLRIKQKMVWCNLQNISTIWLEEDK